MTTAAIKVLPMPADESHTATHLGVGVNEVKRSPQGWDGWATCGKGHKSVVPKSNGRYVELVLSDRHVGRVYPFFHECFIQRRGRRQVGRHSGRVNCG